MDKNIYAELLPSIEEMKVIDTHEHTYPKSQRQLIDLDVFNLFEQYAFFDCISAGLSYEKMRKFVDDKTISLKER